MVNYSEYFLEKKLSENKNKFIFLLVKLIGKLFILEGKTFKIDLITPL